MKRQAGWRLDDNLIKEVRKAAIDADQTAEDFCASALIFYIGQATGDTAVVHVKPDNNVVSLKDKKIEEAYKAADEYIAIRHQAGLYISSTECKTAITGSKYDYLGLTGYIINKLTSMGYIPTKRRIKGKSNPVNVWVKESELIVQNPLA